MRFHLDSVWDMFHQLDEYDRFIIEVVNLDKAHKRAKKELRKQQKAITKKNLYLEYYKRMLRTSQKKRRELKITNEALLNELEQCNQSISNLELKITCLEQENAEKELQERIIKSMNDTMVELRAQLNETEEKYLQLLKRVAGEDEK